MLNATMERLVRTRESFNDLLQQIGNTINAIEAAIAQANFTTEQIRETHELYGIAFNVRGGMERTSGQDIGQALAGLRTSAQNLRSFLASARQTANSMAPIPQQQIDTINRFIQILEG